MTNVARIVSKVLEKNDWKSRLRVCGFTIALRAKSMQFSRAPPARGGAPVARLLPEEACQSRASCPRRRAIEGPPAGGGPALSLGSERAHKSSRAGGIESFLHVNSHSFSQPLACSRAVLSLDARRRSRDDDACERSPTPEETLGVRQTR